MVGDPRPLCLTNNWKTPRLCGVAGWRNDVHKNNRKLVVIGKLREFDEEAWKRLLMAYAYYLHEQRTGRAVATAEDTRSAPGNEDDEAGRAS